MQVPDVAVVPKLELVLDALVVDQVTEPLDPQRVIFVLDKLTVGAVIPKHLQVDD